MDDSRVLFLEVEESSETKYYNYLRGYLSDNGVISCICSEESLLRDIWDETSTFSSRPILILDLIQSENCARKLLQDLVLKDDAKIRIILISSLLTWSNSGKNNGQEHTLEKESLFNRAPLNAYAETLQLENSFLSLQCDSIEVTIVAKGLLYGEEGYDFYTLMNGFLNGIRKVPLIYPGNNCFPSIHIKDFCQLILNVLPLENPPNYVVAADGTPATLGELLQTISEQFQPESILFSDIEEYINFALHNANLAAMLSSNLRFTELPILNKRSLSTCPEGLSRGAILKLAAEFRALNNRSPCYLLIAGAPQTGKSSLAKAFALK